MKFAKFTIVDGNIASKTEIETSDLDEALLAKASDTLTRLRENALGATAPIPERDGDAIGLGSIPVVPFEQIEQAMKASSQGQTMSRDQWEEMQQRVRRYSFCVIGANRLPSQVTVLSESADETAKAGLFGAIGGSFLRSRRDLPEDQRKQVSRDDAKQQALGIVDTIWPERPCFVQIAITEEVPYSSFLDCFAVAMLTNPE